MSHQAVIKYLGFIPARAGSKGIPHKNLKTLSGKPLFMHTLDAALGASLLDGVLVSSDSSEINALVAQKQDSRLIQDYVRPEAVSKDETLMWETVVDALKWLKEIKNIEVTNIVLMQPTSPLRGSQDVDNAISLYEKKNAKALVSVSELAQHPYECIEPTSSGWKFLREPKTPVERRQDYTEKFYFMNNAIYIRNTEDLLKDQRWAIPHESILYEMPAVRGLDINSQLDFEIAKAVLNSDL